MKLEFTNEEVVLLDQIIRANVIADGLALTPTRAKAYECPDEISRREVGALALWLESKVLRKEEKKVEGQETPGTAYFYRPWSGALKQEYILRIIKILDHYKTPCSTMPVVRVWNSLFEKLHGRAADLPDVCEVEAVGEKT